ncbi:hypothetical protein AAL_02262 [Moelleriella libera RCEF 2490]|uniref:Uncharacterized protein n=1 Tax=Moelleriella libera RCEF 2490 TaxID=1081109 RepID=A0A166PXE0_9HYPO|nr:hypothetical protein AAL_02262 [Moelleriella libera RCEF 2490]
MSSTNTPVLPTVSALRRLEPRPGGHWMVNGQSNDTYSLAYFMDGGILAVCYTMHPCTTVEAIRAQCGPLIYTYGDLERTQVKNEVAQGNPCPTVSRTFLPVRGNLNNIPSNISHPGPITIDPLMVNNNIPSTQIGPGERGLDTHFMPAKSQTGNTFNTGQKPTSHRHVVSNPQASTWSIPENRAPRVNEFSRVQDDRSNLHASNPETSMASELWEDEFCNLDTDMDEATSQTNWTPFH